MSRDFSLRATIETVREVLHKLQLDQRDVFCLLLVLELVECSDSALVSSWRQRYIHDCSKQGGDGRLAHLTRNEIVKSQIEQCKREGMHVAFRVYEQTVNNRQTHMFEECVNEKIVKNTFGPRCNVYIIYGRRTQLNTGWLGGNFIFLHFWACFSFSIAQVNWVWTGEREKFPLW